MTYDEILNRFKEGTVVVPGKKVKFDFGDAGKIFLDGAREHRFRMMTPPPTPRSK